MTGKRAEGFEGTGVKPEIMHRDRTAVKEVGVFPAQTIRPQYGSAIGLTDYGNNCYHNELVWRGGCWCVGHHISMPE